jgi:site-specific recombinase XerD
MFDQYLAETVGHDPDAPLFATAAGHSGRLPQRGMSVNDMLRMVKRRMLASGLPARELCCCSFRAGTATNLFEQGVDAAEVQLLLDHSDRERRGATTGVSSTSVGTSLNGSRSE